MSYQKSLQVRVTEIHQVTPHIKHVIFEAADGSDLPHFSGGSHVVVVMRDGTHTYKNPYSLMGDGYHSKQYQIGVRREDPSRGGSAFMHEKVKVGDTLELLPPANLFMIDSFARKHVLIAGGIGITPFRSMLHDLRRAATDYELHYCVRGIEHAAFWNSISNEDSTRSVLHTGANRLDVAALLSGQPSGTHVYVCGPRTLVESVKATAAALGWSASHVHCEEFTHATGGAPFEVSLARSGRIIHVAHNQTMLEALEEANLEPPYMCRGGVCGACETRLIEGQVEHRDHFLTSGEKAGMQKMMICVSRAACKRIVVDL
jgi:ferredoxin-NADP reductase